MVGIALFLPALRTPFFLDDFLHVSMVEGTYPAPRSPLDLYNFVDDATRPSMVARGLLPWWAHPELTLRFLRPLASGLIWADHYVLGRVLGQPTGAHPLPMHLHSLAWWLFAVLAARALFARTLPPRAAKIATAIFALAPCHTMPLAWLANREALESLAFGALGLLCQVRWRDEGRARDALAATSLYALALLAGGEYALSLFGFALAFELSRRKGILGLAPFAAPAALYLAVRARLGYGSFGSGFYTDPFRAPLSLLRALPWRALALVSNGWLTVDSRDFKSTASRVALALLLAAFAALIAFPLRRAIAQHANARWMLVGSLLAMVPVLAVVPSPRVLGVSAIGIAAAIAGLHDPAWRSSTQSQLTHAASIALGFAHLVHGPGSAFLEGLRVSTDARAFVDHTQWLSGRLGDPAKASVVGLRGMAGLEFAPFALDDRGTPPARWRVLSETGHVLARRRDARTLEIVAPSDGGLYPVGAGSLFRSPDAPLRAGDTIDVPGMRASVVSAGEHGARDVVFTFDRDLDDASTTWIVERYEGWREVTLPPIGFGAPYDP